MAPSGKVSFLANQVKLFADGAIISQLMQMRGGYTDGHKGEWIATPQELRAAAKLYWDAGYQIHVHVNGDLGLDVVLDAIERCMRETPRSDHRTVLVHFASSTEGQIARLARLGCIVSANPYYVTAFADRYGQVGLGPDRAMQWSGWVAGTPAGLDLAPFRPADGPGPAALPCMVRREPRDRVGRVADKEQRLTVEQALRAVTLDAAYAWRMEQEMGSIAPGKVANFTVLEEDPLAVNPVKLKDIPVWGTIFEGTVFPVPR